MFCDSNNSVNTGDMGLSHIVRRKDKAHFSLLRIVTIRTPIFGNMGWKGDNSEKMVGETSPRPGISSFSMFAYDLTVHIRKFLLISPR